MAPKEGRSGPESGKGDFEERDLLVGRPEGAGGRSTAGAAQAPPASTSPQPGAHDDAIREILEMVRATAARIDTLQDAPAPEHETAEALARETAALTQAVEDARGALAKPAELAAQREGQASAGARALAEALDKRLRATGWQAEAAAEGMDEMKQTATALDSRLLSLAEDIFRAVDRLRWRPWLTGLAIAAASFVFFVLGAVLQRETDVVSFGEPRRSPTGAEARAGPGEARAPERARQRLSAQRAIQTGIHTMTAVSGSSGATHITAEHRRAFQALTSGACDNFCLVSCFCDGAPAAAIAAAIAAVTVQPAVEDGGDDEYLITPLFVSVVSSMRLTDHDGREA